MVNNLHMKEVVMSTGSAPHGMITREQVKAARNLLGWSQMMLALEADVSTRTVQKIETGKNRSVFSGLKPRTTLDSAGVEFPKDEPPKLKRGAA